MASPRGRAATQTFAAEDQRFLMPQTPSSLEPLLDPKAVAAILRVHQNTVLKLARSGDLPGFRLGRYWRFRRGDVASWVAEKLPEMRSTAYPKAAESNRGG